MIAVQAEPTYIEVDGIRHHVEPRCAIMADILVRSMHLGPISVDGLADRAGVAVATVPVYLSTIRRLLMRDYRLTHVRGEGYILERWPARAEQVQAIAR